VFHLNPLWRFSPRLLASIDLDEELICGCYESSGSGRSCAVAAPRRSSSVRISA